MLPIFRAAAIVLLSAGSSAALAASPTPTPTPAPSPAAAAPAAKYEVTSGKVFRGPEGLKVEVAYLAGGEGSTKPALVRITNAGSAWDGKVILFSVRAYNDKEDWSTKVEGGKYVAIAVRPSWGGHRQWTLSAPGMTLKDPELSFDTKASEAFDPKSLVAGKVYESGEDATK